MKKSLFKNKIFCILTILSLIMLNTTDVFSQVPPVSGAQCVSCKMMNGAHATDCPYNNKGKQQKQPALPSSNQSQEQKMLFDLLFQINNEIDAWVEKEEAIQASINETRKQTKQKVQDSLAKINHNTTKQQLKGLPQETPKQPVSNSYKILDCKSDGNGFKIFSNGIWKEYKDCSEIEKIRLNENDTIYCNEGTEVVLSDDNRNNVVIKEKSQAIFLKREKLLMLLKGSLWAIINGEGKKAGNYIRGAGRIFEVRTPTAICGIRGTIFKVNITDDNQTEILLIEGELEVETISKDESVLLTSGKKITITSDGKIDTISKLDIETLKKLIKEFNNQDK